MKTKPEHIPEIAAWMESAIFCLQQYRDYAEEMRGIGRGFYPTGKLGHTVDGVITGCQLSLKRINARAGLNPEAVVELIEAATEAMDFLVLAQFDDERGDAAYNSLRAALAKVKGEE